MMADEIGPCPRDTQEQAAWALGALRAIEDLVSSRHPDLDIAPGPLGMLLTIVIDATEKVLPLEKSCGHERGANDD